MSNERDIPNDLSIHTYLHCGLCLEERPADQTPKDFQRLQIGMTALGFQVWCSRHEANVMHVDFQGQKHPANTTRKA